jgi:hypothetical protein
MNPPPHHARLAQLQVKREMTSALQMNPPPHHAHLAQLQGSQQTRERERESAKES